MFSLFSQPLVFEPFNSLYDSNLSEQCRKKRKCYYNVPNQNIRRRKVPITLDFSIEPTEDGYKLKLFKLIGKDCLERSLHEQLLKIKEGDYIPSYQIFNDVNGTQYYIEDEYDESAINREAFKKLDLMAVCRSVSKNSFRDYRFEMNKRNDALIISSYQDNVHEEIDIGDVIHDFKITDYNVEELDEDDIAIIDIDLIKKVPVETPKRKSHHKKHKHSHKRKQTTHHKATTKNMLVHYYPILEEVNDEETSRYQQSLMQSNDSAPIIEERR